MGYLKTFYERDAFVQAVRERGLLVMRRNGVDKAMGLAGCYGEGRMVTEGGGEPPCYVGMLFDTAAQFAEEKAAGLPDGCPTGPCEMAVELANKRSRRKEVTRG